MSKLFSKLDVEKQRGQKVIVLIGRKSDKVRYVTAMANFCVEHFKLKRSRFTFIIVPLDEKKPKNGGLTYCDDEKQIIVIFLKLNQNIVQMAQTLAHEFVHVRQMCQGLLKTVQVGRKYLIQWRGKLLHKEMSFLDRPWELQALREQDIVVRRFEEWCCTSVGKRFIINLS